MRAILYNWKYARAIWSWSFLILVKYKLLLVSDYFMIIMIVFLNKLYVNMWLEGFQVCSHRIPDTIIHGPIKWRWLLYKYISVKKKNSNWRKNRSCNWYQINMKVVKVKLKVQIFAITPGVRGSNCYRNDERCSP